MLQLKAFTVLSVPGNVSPRRPRSAGLIAPVEIAVDGEVNDPSIAAGIDHLVADPSTRSNTSVCLRFADRSDAEACKARQKAIVKLLESEGAAYDIGAYRDAPPGLRIWCGATVETADIEALGPWLDWAWEQAQ